MITSLHKGKSIVIVPPQGYCYTMSFKFLISLLVITILRISVSNTKTVPQY